MEQLERLELTKFQAQLSPQSLPSLRVLTLKDCPEILTSFRASEFKPDRRDSGYVEISIPCTGLDAETLLQLLGSKVGDLRNLDLSHSHNLDEDSLAKIVSMGHMDHVLDLNLNGTGVTDQFIELLMTRARELTNVRFAFTQITGIGVKALVTRLDQKLRYLDIRDCIHVSSDAVAFARKTPGLTVRCGVSESWRGKKVRYG